MALLALAALVGRKSAARPNSVKGSTVSTVAVSGKEKSRVQDWKPS